MHRKELYEGIQHLEQKIIQLLKKCERQQKIIQQLRKEQEQWTQQGVKKAAATHHSASSLALDILTKNAHKGHIEEASIDHYISAIDESIAYLEQLQ
mmetsp:Transcript_10280/g.23753  ORF Transcript_10280/g.23753 Transcript_10280/m.23753 type:complete len:97 (-) Transcript_10280:401-691(-)